MVGNAGVPLDLVLEHAVVLAPPEVDVLVVVLHIATIDEVVAEGSDDGVGSGEAGGLHHLHVRTGQKDFLQEGVAHIVVVVVQHDEVVHQGAEDGRVHEDETALLQGFLRHREVHGLDGGVRIGD